MEIFGIALLRRDNGVILQNMSWEIKKIPQEYKEIYIMGVRGEWMQSRAHTFFCFRVRGGIVIIYATIGTVLVL